MQAYALYDNQKREWVDFSQVIGLHTLPALDVRCLRTQEGCIKWRAARLREKPQVFNGRYDLAKLEFEPNVKVTFEEQVFSTTR